TAVTISSGGTWDLNGGPQSVASLSDGSGGGSIISSSNATGAILTLNPTGSTTFSGSIQGGGGLGAISLVFNGPGTQVLSGVNTYTGGTQIEGGVLTFAKKSAQPTSGTISVAAGATMGLGVGSTSAYYGKSDLDAAFNGTMTNVTMSAGALVGID